MLTLFHAPRSRSSAIVQLIDEMGVHGAVTIREVGISRQDGSGGADPQNPHPDGKVPFLTHDGVGMSELNAIALYLTEVFPQTGLGYAPGDPLRGPYLSWLAWYGNVLEPVLHFHFFQIDSPQLARTFRDFPTAMARIEAQLAQTPWLIGDRYSAADLLVVQIFLRFPALMPETGPVPDWVARCAGRPAAKRIAKEEAAG
ncbi:glutathione S-transferase family protein [Pseudooceanicola sp.]|uniref:glutathione S-transferase family protein n=1 Tax=Pseudooceanicola sp. TaxID=1914328 RepID=UPI00262967F9|nr:glutathione S-transferase family protein [Pseudooceanicola sp.]MDF1854536.1 glutathione S-transferase family protein [Pseudooceanicola sp.]